MALNTNGALTSTGNVVGCGGLLRGSDGKWIRGFSKRLESCDLFMTELWGVF